MFLSDVGELKIISFYEFFYLPYESWVELITKKINFRIKKTIEPEKVNKNKHRIEISKNKFNLFVKYNDQSINNVCSIFNRITTFWKTTNWPNKADNKFFFKETIEFVLSSMLHYSSLIQEQNHELLHLLKSKEIEPTVNLFLKLMTTANDIHRIRDGMKKFVNDMLEVANEDTQTEMSEEVILKSANSVLMQTVSKTLEIIVDFKITIEFKSFFFYLFESPESATAQEVRQFIFKHFWTHDMLRQVFILSKEL